MTLDDDRAAGGERRCGVTARGREREGEVAGAEHGHRAERHLALTDVGARQRLAIGLSRIDAYTEVVAATYDVGEHA